VTLELEERAWGYIEGTLEPREVERFERDLFDPEVAQAFSEALMLRELLRSVGPDEAPADLVSDIEEAVLRDVFEAHPEARRGWLQPNRGILGGLSWALRGPTMAFTGSSERTRGALSGVGATRYALGPLADRGRTGSAEPTSPPRRRWWKRALRLGRAT
jgi:hypothetical protein